MNLEFKKIHEKAQLPSKAFPTDACYDIKVVSDDEGEIGCWYTTNPADGSASQKAVLFYPGFRRIFHTGLQCAIPKGFALFFKDRSGMAAKHGIHVLAGIIDEQYRGELLVCLINLNPDKYTPYKIFEGDKIAQAYLAPVYNVEPIFVDELSSTDRGEGGFGSSGR